jgi:hypothetical protein
MEIQLSKNSRKWSLYGALLTAMAYSALTLTSQPAYAATCTQARCQSLSTTCTDVCTPYGVHFYACVPGSSTAAICGCNPGGPVSIIDFPC